MADFGKLNFAVAFNPQTAFPLDARYLFDSLEAAQAAASGAVEVGSSSGTYFFGQNVAVVADGVATLYVIQPDGSLSPVGSAPVGDNKSIVVTDGVIALDGFAQATQGQQPRVAADGTLEWYTPDASTVEGLQQTVGQLQTDVTALQGEVGTINSTLETKANISDVYTQQQTDEKIAAAITAVYKPAGSVAFAQLPETPSAETLGNVYNVTDEFEADTRFVTGEQGQTYPAGSNVAVVEVDGSYYFDVLTGLVDLSGYLTITSAESTYATQEALNTGLAQKVNVAEGYSLVQDTLITKLQNLADIKTVAEGQLSISEAGELGVVAIDQSQVTGLPEALANKVDAVPGKGLSTNDFTDELQTKLEGIEAGAQVNTIEAVNINGAPLPIEDQAVNIPLADADSVGVVMGSVAENQVAVEADGTMTVNSLNVTKLTQGAEDVMILNGGSSTASNIG